MSDDVTVPEKSENVLPAHFDPDAASTEGSGMYGLPFAPEDSRVIVIPVPFEATTSVKPKVCAAITSM